MRISRVNGDEKKKNPQIDEYTLIEVIGNCDFYHFAIQFLEHNLNKPMKLPKISLKLCAKVLLGRQNV